MKLKDYVGNYARMMGMFDENSLRAYMKEVFSSGDFDNFDRRILFDIYYCINRLNAYRVYDDMLAQGFAPNDNHIFTMMKAAFKQQFGMSPTEFTAL